MAVWSNRFEQKEDEALNEFNASISFDQRLYPYDIQGSLAHLLMLENQGILTFEQARNLEQGLKALLADLEAGEIPLDLRYEDIHMAIEELLTQRIGEDGKRLHTARSRNDQVALDVRLFVRDQLLGLKKKLVRLEQVLLKRAGENLETIMPGYTHLQRAQPITLAHWLMAYASMFLRDLQRLDNTLEIMDASPLGAGALAASTYDLDRKMTARALGFSGPVINSLDAVSDRDYCIEALSDCSMIMMHLSRLSEELINFSSYEFGFLHLDDTLSTGSSIMPQKKNNDLCELIRGKTGRVYGSLISLLTTMKSLPLAYNKDMQEDKEAVFNGLDTTGQCVDMMHLFMSRLHPDRQAMLKACKEGYLNATDLADYLTKKGLPFREAYQISGRIVREAAGKKTALEDLPLEYYQSIHPLFDSDLYEAIDLIACVKARRVEGGPAPQAVKDQIAFVEEKLKEYL